MTDLTTGFREFLSFSIPLAKWVKKYNNGVTSLLFGYLYLNNLN